MQIIPFRKCFKTASSFLWKIAPYIWALTLQAQAHNYVGVEQDPLEFGFGDDLSLLPIARASKSEVIQNALSIRDQIAKANFDDLKALIQQAQALFKESGKSKASVLNQAEGLLNRQAEITREIAVFFDNHPKYSYLIRYELRKLYLRNVYVYANEILISHGDELLDGRLPFLPAQRQIVDLKFALAHLIKSIQPEFDLFRLLSSQKLTYPAVLPSSCIFPFRNYTLFDDKNHTIWLPNSGYIMTADPVNCELRGTDCSGFVSLALGKKDRLFTKDLSDIWNVQREKICPAQLSKQAQCEIGSYVAIDPSEIAEGDLVTWRWKVQDHEFGHVVIFVKWAEEPNQFYSLELAMLPDLNLDGVGMRILNLHRKHANLTILRKK